ncbi:MAG: hypothetical protein ACHREM_31570, partial [Polyangiales bacterium]
MAPSSSRAWSLLGAAMLRPLNVAMPGIGLLAAIGTEHWWAFPAALIPYAIGVALTVRDPSFVRRALAGESAEAAGEEFDWDEVTATLSA